MSRRDASAEPDRNDGSKPMRKIDDATYGTPPTGRIPRRLTHAKRWFQLDASRWFVTVVLLSASFATIVLVGSFGPVPASAFLTDGISPGAALLELLRGIISVVVIVLAINQLVLSPGLGPVGDQRDRFEQTMALREEIEAHTNVRVSPTSPARVLRVLADALVEGAERLRDVTAGTGDRALHDETNEYTEAVLAEATSIRSLLADSRFGGFDATSAALRFAISEKVGGVRDVRKRHEGELSEAQAEAFDEMEALLELFTVTREYLKTVYIRSEYIRLSEALLYAGLPSLVLTYCAAQIYSPTLFPGRILGIEYQLLFVSGAVTVALVPFVLLVAYIFRLAAMSRSTLFIGPFAARASVSDPADEVGSP